MDRRQAIAAIGWTATGGLPLAKTFPRGETSPFLEGIYAPVTREITSGPLKVEGTLPPSLEGIYLRNGPNPRFAPKGRYHWFDGDGMIHGVRLSPSHPTRKAVYLNRWVRTAGFVEEEKAGKALYPGLLEWPDLAKVAKGEDGYKNAANTALCWHHGQLWALWEGGAPHRIDPQTLQTQGPVTFQDQWKGAFTAHPKIDPLSGEMVFFGYGPAKPYLKMGILSPNGEVTKTRDIDLPRPVMVHDFAITQDFALFLDMPQTFSFSNLALGKGVFAWEPKHGARLGVIPRRDGPVRWFPIEPGAVFHTLGAWQSDQKVTLFACRMATYPADILAGKTDRVPLKEKPALHRYVLDLASGKVEEGPFDDPGSDMPRMDDQLTSRPARYGYTMETEFQGLRKHDLIKGTTRRLEMPSGYNCGEPVFVRNGEPKAEDDGHLVFLVQPSGPEGAQLWVVNAREFDPKPVAKVHLDVRVPMGFHGLWLKETTG